MMHIATLAPPNRQQLVSDAYPQLRRLARRFLMHENSGHTLQATALVHEAFLRMIDQTGPVLDTGHFVALASQMMRRVLINHALSRKAEKRGGGQLHEELDDDLPVAAESRGVDVLALDQALLELRGFDERQAQIVDLRFFAGLSIEETAEAMSVSPATVKRDWLTAKLWLRRRLND
jgi:RNA polymerase sigma factor (TIGR02999 family)